MDISQFKMFKSIAEQGSIVRASNLLNCVPSNITNRIKQLEDELGVQLFIRKGRGLIITPSGEIFLGYVNKIIGLCEEARLAVQPASIPTGILKIGAIESSAISRLPAILSMFNCEFPQVKIQLYTGTWKQLVNDVAEYRLDGAIIATEPVHPDISHEIIYEEELLLICSSSLGEISRTSILNKNFFMWPYGCPYRQALENWLCKKNIHVEITDISSYGTIIGCVSSGAGFSLVPAGIYNQPNKPSNLKCCALLELPTIKNYFIKNKNVEVHHARKAFESLLNPGCLSYFNFRKTL